MSEIKVGQKVLAKTIKSKTRYQGVVQEIKDTAKGEWIVVKRDVDGHVFATRPSCVNVAR